MVLPFGVRSKSRMGSANRVALFVIGGLVLVAGLAFWQFSRKTEPVISVKQQSNAASHVELPATATNPSIPKDWVTLGGVARPATDVKKSGDSQMAMTVPLKPEGAPPVVAPDANEQVKQVHEALLSKKNPERLSSFVFKPSFDEAAFKANPAKYAAEYAKIVEPGRVFAPAQPSPSTPVLRSTGDRIHRVQQGESVRLSVIAVPNAPISFTSFGMGQFENLLSSVTVVADAQGKAEASFTASSGTKNEVKILAASPLLTEQVAFTVSVRLPPPKESL